jgi:hypothetical protein
MSQEGKLYNEYEILHDYFGRRVNDVIKWFKDIRKYASEVK